MNGNTTVVDTHYGVLLSLKEERHSGICSCRGEAEDIVLRKINQTQMVYSQEVSTQRWRAEGLLPGAQGRAWEVGTNVARHSVSQDDKCMAGSQPWECTSSY